MHTQVPSELSDRDLLAETARVVAVDRATTAQLIARLAEVDSRRLYLGEGYSSLFTYCTHGLRLSEHAAYERITAARVSQRLPAVLDRLTDGSVTLTVVGLLAPQLSDDNCERLLEAARHKSKREVERLVACIDPKPDVASSVRRVPVTQSPLATSSTSLFVGASEPGRSCVSDNASSCAHIQPRAQRATIAPIAPERYVIKVTVGADTHAKLCRAQDLLRHAIPNGDPAAVLDRALTVLVEQLERTRFSSTRRPILGRAERRPISTSSPPGTRHLAAQIKREVWARDDGRCAFVGVHGRCAETGFLEFHHVVPYADGGATSVENLSLRCRPHNGHEAKMWSEECGRT